MNKNEVNHKKKDKQVYILLSIFTLVSFVIKLILILTEGNNLTLFSDDLNYVKSAVALIKKGIFVFHEYNEPTVFITPLYPLFLAGIFKVFGYGFTGLQAARIIQAILSLLTVVLVFLIAKGLFDKKTALIAAFFVSFYFPNIVTSGYFLTETLFSVLLALLVYLSFKFSSVALPKKLDFGLLGIVWAIAALCRPTIALYPVILFLYLFACKKINFREAVKLGASMAISFIILMSPWWLRNYREYNEFIPLAASSGNPMLQGTYINYLQTPENIVYYKLGKNAFETNKIEVEVSKKRIRDGFKQNFTQYLKWYTVGKTRLFWGTVFYWREFMGISLYTVVLMHYLILLGFAGILKAAYLEFLKYRLIHVGPGQGTGPGQEEGATPGPGYIFGPVIRRSKRDAPDLAGSRQGTIPCRNSELSKHILIPGILLYFNAVHCYYMAFDRYAFPLIPLLSVYTGYFINSIFRIAHRKFIGKKQYR